MTHKNGRLPASALTPIGARQALESVAARAWLALVAAAERAGHVLALTDSYRPLAAQEAVFLARYEPREDGKGPFGDVKYWRGVRYVRVRGASAAVPGTSNHGTGRAVDITGIYTNHGEPRHRTYLWLAANAPAYGWTNPAWASSKNFWEPWHWEYAPATDTHPEIEEPEMIRAHRFRTKPITRPAGAWHIIPLTDTGDTSACTRLGPFDALAQFRFAGLKPGAVVQVRFVRVETDAKGAAPKVVGRFPITEIIGTKGDTFGQAAQKGTLKAVSGAREERLRVEVLLPKGVTIRAVEVRTDTYNG